MKHRTFAQHLRYGSKGHINKQSTKAGATTIRPQTFTDICNIKAGERMLKQHLKVAACVNAYTDLT